MTDFTSIRKAIAAHLLLTSAMWHFSASDVHAQANGTLDPNFNTTGYNINDISGNSTADAAVGLVLMSNGRYFVAGYAGPSGSFDRKFGLARYAADGGLQASAQRSYPIGLNIMNAKACAKDPLATAYYVAGTRINGGTTYWVLGLFREDLFSETQYGSGSTAGYAQVFWDEGPDSKDVGGMATQPDGKVVLAGHVGGNIAMARFTSTGALDNTFSSDGKVITDVPGGTDERLNAVGVAPDGGIIVAGAINTSPSGSRGLVGRYTPSGDIDFTFGTNGFTTINYTGSVAPGGWGIGGNTLFNGMIIQPDGKIVVVGRCTSTAGDQTDFIIARLNANGSLDTSFGGNGLVKVGFIPSGSNNTDVAESVAMDDSGGLVVAGTVGGGVKIGLVRVLANGTVDLNFGSNGMVQTDLGSFLTVGAAIVDGQRVVVSGGVITGSGTASRNTFIARYFSNTVGVVEFALVENGINIYPNPINEAVTFEYTLQESERLTIALHDLQGQVITTFLDGKHMPAGEHRQTVAMPADLASGNYLLVFTGEKGRMAVQVTK